MQFVSYAEYTSMGGVLEESTFNRYIDRACLIIERKTFGRLSSFSETPREVKLLCRDMVEFLQTEANGSTATSRSQSAGGVSESVSYKTDAELDVVVDSMVADYLTNVTNADGVSVLYKGARF